MNGIPYRQGGTPFLTKGSGYIQEYDYIYYISQLINTEESNFRTRGFLYPEYGYRNEYGC